MPHLRSLIPNLCSGATRRIRDFDLRLGGCGICALEIYFSIFFWKIKNKKDWSDTQPDSTIQPKARGLLHMEREYFAYHIWSEFRGLSTSQPRSNRKYLNDYSTYLKKRPEATRRMFWLLEALDACRTQLRRARGLVRPGVVRLLIGLECSRIKDSAWIYLTSFVNTRIGVELVTVQGNYPTGF